LKQAWSRIQFTYDPLKLSLFQQANNAYDIGFLAKGKPRPDVSGIYDLTLLNQVLKEKGLQPIESGEISTGTGTGTSKGGLAEAIP
jgi:NitT/TauT family transport system substrate-binding protein